MNETKKAQGVLPGDKLAVAEEFLPGPHAYDSAGLVRALRAGSVVRDTKNMEISVKPAAEPELFRVEDWVTGQVEGSQANSANVHVFFHNRKPTYKDFAGMLSLRGLSGGGRGERGARRTTPVKPGDLVRCRVFSLVNGIIHLTIDEPDMGVVSAHCGNCGKPLLRGSATKAKCDECGNVEDRKLARDFGTVPIEP